MHRRFRRRIEREGNKIKPGKSCTKFLERNGLLQNPYVLLFQTAKVCDDIVCVYSVGIFEFKDGLGFPELVTTCLFTNSLFRVLSHLELGFVCEEDLEDDEEIQL